MDDISDPVGMVDFKEVKHGSTQSLNAVKYAFFCMQAKLGCQHGLD